MLWTNPKISNCHARLKTASMSEATSLMTKASSDRPRRAQHPFAFSVLAALQVDIVCSKGKPSTPTPRTSSLHHVELHYDRFRSSPRAIPRVPSCKRGQDLHHEADTTHSQASGIAHLEELIHQANMNYMYTAVQLSHTRHQEGFQTNQALPTTLRHSARGGTCPPR
jgi:hypothetical protein